uniref:Uncharacterized protein n=1 Tax=viral metagenome TaxID=1070528 RepID=A0A6M3KTJ6_9ZZZZ
MNAYLKGKLGILIVLSGFILIVYLSVPLEIYLDETLSAFALGAIFILWILGAVRIANAISNNADRRRHINMARTLITAELDPKAIKALIKQAIEEANFHVNHASIPPGTTAIHIIANSALCDIKNTLQTKQPGLPELNRIVNAAITTHISAFTQSALTP